MVNQSWELGTGSAEKPRGEKKKKQHKKPHTHYFSFLNPVHCAAAKAALLHNRRGKAEAGISSADAAPKLWSEQPQCEFAGLRLPEMILPTGSRKNKMQALFQDNFSVFLLFCITEDKTAVRGGNQMTHLSLQMQ